MGLLTADRDRLEQLVLPEADQAPGSLCLHPALSPDPSLTFAGLQDQSKSTNTVPRI